MKNSGYARSIAQRDRARGWALRGSDEASRFARGDFTDPMAIHGMQMPGVDELRRNAARVVVEYSSAARGARITYTTDAPTLRGALHEWFDAQLMDHGTNAHG